MFEIAVIRGVESDDDGHLLAQGKSSRPSASAYPRFELPHFTQRLENLAKIVHFAKQCRKVHFCILSIFASLSETIERILFCADGAQEHFLKQNSG
jgi:hypothetical protein